MTPTEQKAFDQMRETVERLQKRLVTKCQEQLVTFSFVDVDILNAAAEALTAANAVTSECSKVTSEYSEQLQAQGIAWDEGYAAGVNDEQISESSIGVAGFGAKVKPARENPYLR